MCISPFHTQVISAFHPYRVQKVTTSIELWHGSSFSSYDQRRFKNLKLKLTYFFLYFFWSLYDMTQLARWPRDLDLVASDPSSLYSQITTSAGWARRSANTSATTPSTVFAARVTSALVCSLTGEHVSRNSHGSRVRCQTF